MKIVSMLLLVFVCSGIVSAQVPLVNVPVSIDLGFGGGISSPSGDLSNVSKTGWNAGAKVRIKSLLPMNIVAMVHRNSLPQKATSNSDGAWMLGAGLEYGIPAVMVSPYLGADAMLNISAEEDALETGLVEFPPSTTNIVAITAGSTGSLAPGRARRAPLSCAYIPLRHPLHGRGRFYPHYRCGAWQSRARLLAAPTQLKRLTPSRDTDYESDKPFGFLITFNHGGEPYNRYAVGDLRRIGLNGLKRGFGAIPR